MPVEQSAGTLSSFHAQAQSCIIASVFTSADVFRTVADSTRRQLLDSLLSGEKTASELSAPFSASQQAVSLHLQDLRKAGLVEVRKDGRFRRYRLRGHPISEIYEWALKYKPFFDPYGHAWSFAPATQARKSRSRIQATKQRMRRRK
jgi:DNA-binding transcriptional ArsR family regulator